MDKVQFDHTEKGSFIITISTKVPPILKVPDNNDENIIIEEPFERRVMMNLILALEACREASKKALISNDINAFETAIDKGVSANLCEAIVGISNSCGNEHLDISMEWSLGRPVPKCTPDKIEFNKEFLPFISEAARTFKATKPIEEFELRGVVVKLARNDGKKDGEITVFGLLEGQQKKVNIKLEKTLYERAIKAHKEGIPISCVGRRLESRTIIIYFSPRRYHTLFRYNRYKNYSKLRESTKKILSRAAKNYRKYHNIGSGCWL